MHGSLTGIKSVTRGNLPYLLGNFCVNTKLTKDNLLCGNALPGNLQPSQEGSWEKNDYRAYRLPNYLFYVYINVGLNALKECKHECGGDTDWAEDLICFQRNANTLVPGCDE